MEACPPVARFARLDSFVTESAVVVFARTAQRHNKALLRIRATLCAQSLSVFHRSLSALRPLSARIAELSR